MSAVGFDIGNDSSYIAVVKSGGIEVLDNEYSLRSTPTYIAFTDKCRDIGVSARNKLVTNVLNTAFGFKRLLGKKITDPGVNDELGYIPNEINELPSGNIGIKVNYLKNSTVFSIEQLMAMILTKLKMVTESNLRNTIRDCVIAVPIHYTDIQRRVMLDACAIAGLNAVQLINESAAVALSYGYFKNLSEEESRNIIFIDLGHSSLTVTACVFTKSKIKVVGCVSDNVGGRDFDNKLVEHFIVDFKARYDINAEHSKKALMSLIVECEALKKAMSASSLEVGFQLECFMYDKDVGGRMKREDFERISAHVLNRIKVTLHKILVVADFKPNDIYSVELVGGSCRIPAVKELVRNVFGKEPNSTLNQDEAVARGCALQCAMLSPLLKSREFLIEDIPSYPIKIVWKNLECKDEELVVFSLSDKIPAERKITISMSKPFSLNAGYVEFSKLYKIGTFKLVNVPQIVESKGSMKVQLRACLNVHGIFTLTSAKMIDDVECGDKKSLVSFVGEGGDTNVDNRISEGENVSASDQQDIHSSSVVKYYELAVNADVLGLSSEKRKEYVDEERQIIRQYIEEKDRADAQNALEEFIYEIKGKLNDELEAFIEEKEKTALLQRFKETEDWLYENDELNAAKFLKRLRELKKLLDPACKRKCEWEKRQCVIDNYEQSLKMASGAFNDILGDEKSANVVTDEIDKLLHFYENSKQYLEVSKEKLSNLRKCEDFSVTANELEKALTQFKTNFQNSYFEIMQKINDAQKMASESGDTEKPQNSTSDSMPPKQP